LGEAADRDAFDVLRFRDGRVFERYSMPQLVSDTVVGRVWSFRDVTEREGLLRRATFLADATRLLSSLDIKKALASVAQLAVPYLGKLCAVDLIHEGSPDRLPLPQMEAIREFRSCILPPSGGIRSSTPRDHDRIWRSR